MTSLRKKMAKEEHNPKVIGRLYAVGPSEGERFYLRLLLNHVTSLKSFDDLLTVDGVHYLTFKQAAEKHGLLEDDNSIRECLVEARSFRMPYARRSVKVLNLSENMRAQHDPHFFDFLLRVGNGDEPTIENDMIRIPDSMAMHWEGENSIDELINAIFPDLSSHMYDTDYMENRAIITHLNDDVNKLNEKAINAFPGEEVTYYSFDSALDDTRNLYLPKFLNSISPGNLPPISWF
ncbi:hypothetical protein Sango_2714300 [Sesamum angolense]|uniref:ATP-dependent DNA helicase n=1 Tax=Sesamum angolense TaxID=2727404 RepID=A0AAE1W393_9LAMI|nr:hypothetical protein Sango_2714300 [Sesamum angolense]